MKGKISSVAAIVMATASMAAAQAAADQITDIINEMLCNIITVLWGVSAGVATIVIVLAGIKWIGSSEDAGARAQAKSTIIHAIIGLLIVMVALVLVNWVISGSSPLATLTFDCAA